MKKEKGFSLVVATGIVLIVALLSMVTLAAVIRDTNLTGGLYSRSITLNTAESGIHRAAPTLLEGVEDNFTVVLGTQNGAVLQGEINYINIGDTHFTVTLRDNDDLDGNLQVDTDNRVIINSVGTMDSGGKTELEVLMLYIGKNNEYAQETGGSRSNSDFSSEVDVSNLDNVISGGR